MSLLSLLRQLFHNHARKSPLMARKGRRRYKGSPLILEALEDRLVPDAVVWNVATSGNWNDANNWLDQTTNTAQVPTSADDVTINQSNITITVSDSQAAHSLTTSLTNDLVVQTGGSLTLAADSTLNGGLSLSGSLTANGTLTLAGASSWSAGSIAGTGTLTNTGTLTLSGSSSLPLDEDLTNSSTLVVGPGATLALDGNYTQGSSATLDVQLGGTPGSGQFGQVTVGTGHSATLNGTLKAELVNGYVPSVGDNFTVMSYPANSGTTFASTNLPSSSGVVFQSQVESTGVSLQGDAVPVITTQPNGETVTAGQTATFTADATGTPAPTVQWQVSTDGGAKFSNVPGATSTTLSFTAAAGQNGNVYQAVFTNGAGTATSSTATLAVDFAPTITSNPSDLDVAVGQTATFSAAAAANPPATVQWQVSTDQGATFNDIPGATTTTLSFTFTAGDDGNEYQAVFTNSLGSATTTAATLSVGFAPTITAQPSNVTVNAGQTATFTAAADGKATPTVQWQVSTDGGATFTNIGGATSTTLSVTAAATENGSEYHAVFTNDVGSATTSAATLSVEFVPIITTQPANVAAAVGQTATFTAGISSNPAATVQWQVSTNGGFSFADIPGATSPALSFTVSAAKNGYQYQAVISNSMGTVTTGFGTLVVVQASTPTFGSANHATFIAGSAGSFTVVTISSAMAAVSEVGKLPSGLTFTDKGNGTATISGTPASGTNGTYHLALLAFNGKSGSQTFTLTVSPSPPATQPTSAQAPAIVAQPIDRTVTAGVTATFMASASALPDARVQWQVSTNGGTTFKNIAGATSAALNVAASVADNGYRYRAVFTNSLGSATSDAAIMTVVKALAITSLNHATFKTGTTSSFTTTTSASPVAALSLIGGLPTGLTFTDNGNGTATISGTPDALTAGTYTLIFVADNDIGYAIQTFTLTIR
jgi:hypothetical protein